MITGQFAALDIEATGMDPVRHEIIEVAVVVFTRDSIVDRFDSLVRPKRRLSLDIASLTGISPDDAQRAPTIGEVAPQIRRLIVGRPIVGHSAGLDVAMLAAAGVELRGPVYDTHTLATLLVPDLPVYSLSGVAAALGIDSESGHRAATDAELNALVFRALLDRIDRHDPTSLERLVALCEAAGWPFSALFAAAAQQVLAGPLFQDADDSRRAPHELAFLTTRERPEPLRLTGSAQPIAMDEVSSLLSAEGPLSTIVPGYEHRPAQERMAQVVAGALNGDGRLIVEAGTGTGKSVAYLLPAALHATERGEPIVISTNTLALQDQLYSKDIPDLQRALGNGSTESPLDVAVLKGRGNYLCLRRWFNYQRQPLFGTDDARLRAKVHLWLGETETGDRAELRLTSEEERQFRMLSAEGEACAAARCVYQQRNQCFLYRARREAEHAHLVIVNHALLLSDILEGNHILPDYERLIVDEAHHLEDQATAQFGFTVSEAILNDHLDAVVRLDGADVVGSLQIVANFLPRVASDEAAQRRAASCLERLRPALDRATATKSAIADLFGRLHEFEAWGDGDRGGYDRTLRVTPSLRRDSSWVEIELTWERLDRCLREVEAEIRASLDAIERVDPPAVSADEGQLEDLAGELTASLREGAELRAKLQETLTAPSAEAIYWLERSQLTGRMTIHAAPLHVGDLLRDRLFDSMQSVVLTSATMTTDGTFDYLRGRLGLTDAKELALPSPFDYERSTLLYLADDVPEPNLPGYQRKVQETLIELCGELGGRTLALFTSHAALQATYKAIRGPLEDRGVIVLAQRTDGSPRQLVERLKHSSNVVVLGTATFWEGVDVVGSALSALVIVKLPFSVPSDPVFAARSEQFDEPFVQYAVPQAVLKFKQGFGRLIRSSQDRGICAVLDRRVISKRYGASFVQSLPACSVTVGSCHDLPRAASAWLDDADGSDRRSRRTRSGGAQ